MKLYDGGILVFLIVAVVATSVGSLHHQTQRKEQELKFYIKCMDSAVVSEDIELCGKLFTNE